MKASSTCVWQPHAEPPQRVGDLHLGRFHAAGLAMLGVRDGAAWPQRQWRAVLPRRKLPLRTHGLGLFRMGGFGPLIRRRDSPARCGVRLGGRRCRRRAGRRRGRPSAERCRRGPGPGLTAPSRSTAQRSPAPLRHTAGGSLDDYRTGKGRRCARSANDDSLPEHRTGRINRPQWRPTFLRRRCSPVRPQRWSGGDVSGSAPGARPGACRARRWRSRHGCR